MCLSFKDSISLYDEDLPSPSNRDTELHCWLIKWQSRTDVAKELDTPSKALASTDGDFSPNTKDVISTLPVTSLECDHSISRLRHLKTYFGVLCLKIALMVYTQGHSMPC